MLVYEVPIGRMKKVPITLKMNKIEVPKAPQPPPVDLSRILERLNVLEQSKVKS